VNRQRFRCFDPVGPARKLAPFLAAASLPIVKGDLMYFQVYDASGKLRFKSDNWPMARSALDLVISEGEKDGRCPFLLIDSESWGIDPAYCYDVPKEADNG